MSLGGIAAAIRPRQPADNPDNLQRLFSLLYGFSVMGSLAVFLRLGKYIQFTALALALSAMVLPLHAPAIVLPDNSKTGAITSAGCILPTCWGPASVRSSVSRYSIFSGK